ncbi:hypothetical protein Taro_003002 [Colocasia esculenta]|uniref:Zinc finger Mcm10/DnaG-type domain-containing protein n=1 Tax=Colocasia esculenta TaxID=4460 RepID=A0A843TI31_COLES|nr:hypothetical protein [Colocasia esculenta]
MAAHDEDDDLGLLLSLRERVPETPPGSPPPPSPSHLSEFVGYPFGDGSPRRTCATADMSVFRDVVKDYLGGEVDAVDAATSARKQDKPKRSDEVVLEKFSGLRIRNLLVSGVELSHHFSDVRFIRLLAIKNSIAGDNISGCWATVGVLTEKGNPKLSSTGKNFCVWKVGCLDESVVSVFLFGDAYTKNSKEPVGTVFGLFNSSIRKDAGGKGFSLSVFSAGQILKMGTSADYSVCKGKRKDGMPCTLVINKRNGVCCKYHMSNASQKYSTMRSELKGGNLRTAFRLQSEGIHLVDPLKGKSSKTVQPVKVLSVDGLKRILSNAGKVTTNSRSQGIRFLSEVAAKPHLQSRGKGDTKSNQANAKLDKRLSPDVKVARMTATVNIQPEAKRTKTSEKLVELDFVSSDEER